MCWISRKLVNDHPDNSYIHVCYTLLREKYCYWGYRMWLKITLFFPYIWFVLFTTFVNKNRLSVESLPVSVFECLLIFVFINAFVHVATCMLLKAWTISCTTSVPHWYQYFMRYLKAMRLPFITAQRHFSLHLFLKLCCPMYRKLLCYSRCWAATTHMNPLPWDTQYPWDVGISLIFLIA